MSKVADLLRTRLDEINAKLESEGIAELLTERDEITTELKRLERRNGSAPSGVDDDAIKKVLVDAATALRSSEVAEELDVDTRAVSRRLKRLAELGEIEGDKDAGYFIS